MSSSRLQRSFVPLSVTVLSIVLMELSASYIGGESPLFAIRWIVGLTFIMFVPGYCLVEAVFPEDQRNKLNRIERFVLNVGLSLMITILALLVLNIIWIISLFSIIITMGLINFILSFAALYRDLKLLMLRLQGAQQKIVSLSAGGRLADRLRGYYDLILPSAALFVALFCFIIRPLFSAPSATYAYTFTMNTNNIDSILLIIGAFVLLVILSVKKGSARFLCYIAIAVSIFVAAKARMYPNALVSTGLAGNRWGVDTWDTLGHINFVLRSGRSTLFEPFLLFYEKGGGVIQAYDGLLAPGFFCFMAAICMVTGLTSIQVCRALYLFSVLDVMMMFALVKRRTGDDAKAVFSAFLIAGGSLTNLLVQFSNGMHSPIGVAAFPLLLFGLYLLTFKGNTFVYTLWTWLIIILLNFHYVTGLIYLLILLVFHGGRAKLSIRGVRAFFKKVRGTKNILGNVFIIALFGLMVTYILTFWMPTFMAYSKRWGGFELVIHHRPLGPESPWELTLFQLGDSLYFFLALYGLASSIRRRDVFFASWLFSLFSLWIFLILLGPTFSYRVLAYIFQAGCAAGGSAVVCDFIYRPLSHAKKSSAPSIKFGLKRLLTLKIFTSLLIVFTILYLALFSVFVRNISPAPLGLWAQGSMAGTELTVTLEDKLYLEATFWAAENLPEGSVVVIPPYTLRAGLRNTVLDNVVSTLRSVGVTMLVIPFNLSLSEFYTISGMYNHLYLLVSDNFPLPPALNLTMVREVYSPQMSGPLHWVKLFSLQLP